MTEPLPDRPEPVVDAARRLGILFAGAVLAVGGLWFALAEGVTRDNIGTVATLAGGAATAVVAFVAYLLSLRQGRKTAEKVTPLADPRDARGVVLVPADTYGEHAADRPPDPPDVLKGAPPW